MYEYRIEQVVKVIDGDTIDVIIDLGFNTFIKKRVRIFGINTPETRTRDLKEKALGFKAKDRVEELLLNNRDTLAIKSYGQGKFGRVLGAIYLSESNPDLGSLLVSEGHAEEYFGGKR